MHEGYHKVKLILMNLPQHGRNKSFVSFVLSIEYFVVKSNS